MPMPGMWTQGLFVLTSAPPDKPTLDRALKPFDVARYTDEPEPDRPFWMGGHPTWTLAMRREVNGAVLVDTLARPWPDSMGDPQQDAELFAAWSMGFLGPHTFPDTLDRALQFCPVADALKDAARKHTSFVRIRSSYILGADKDTKVLPEDYDPRAELEYVTDVARAVLASSPGAIAYFNPAGETLAAPSDFDAIRADCKESDLPPLPLWCGHRVVRLDDQAPGWAVADSIGMNQLDLFDHEACFPTKQFQPDDMVSFLRNVMTYTSRQGDVIAPGQTTDGPGGVWRAFEVEDPLLPSPRRILRWLPDNLPAPQSLVPKGAAAAAAAPTNPTPSGFLNRLKSMFRS